MEGFAAGVMGACGVPPSSVGRPPSRPRRRGIDRPVPHSPLDARGIIKPALPCCRNPEGEDFGPKDERDEEDSECEDESGGERRGEGSTPAGEWAWEEGGGANDGRGDDPARGAGKVSVRESRSLREEQERDESGESRTDDLARLTYAC